MSKTNCINCGAGKEVSDLQCPFCGTKYADLTTFDFMSDEPIYIQLKSRNNIITAKAYITNRELSFHPDTVSYRDMHGRLRVAQSRMNVEGKIGFTLYENI